MHSLNYDGSERLRERDHLWHNQPDIGDADDWYGGCDVGWDEPDYEPLLVTQIERMLEETAIKQWEEKDRNHANILFYTWRSYVLDYWDEVLAEIVSVLAIDPATLEEWSESIADLRIRIEQEYKLYDR